MGTHTGVGLQMTVAAQGGSNGLDSNRVESHQTQRS
jgi:hypothetical protein